MSSTANNFLEVIKIQFQSLLSIMCSLINFIMLLEILMLKLNFTSVTSCSCNCSAKENDNEKEHNLNQIAFGRCDYDCKDWR